MGQTANDMVLGTASYKAGIRATTFGPRDKGIGYLVGAADDPQIVRSAYLDGPATEAHRGPRPGRPAGRRHPVRARARRGPPRPPGETASILDHILTVVPAGEGKVWSETVAERLAEAHPDLYAGWGPDQLAAALQARWASARSRSAAASTAAGRSTAAASTATDITAAVDGA